jgi:hypothetical protein
VSLHQKIFFKKICILSPQTRFLPLCLLKIPFPTVKVRRQLRMNNTSIFQFKKYLHLSHPFLILPCYSSEVKKIIPLLKIFSIENHIFKAISFSLHLFEIKNSLAFFYMQGKRWMFRKRFLKH